MHYVKAKGILSAKNMDRFRSMVRPYTQRLRNCPL